MTSSAALANAVRLIALLPFLVSAAPVEVTTRTSEVNGITNDHHAPEIYVSEPVLIARSSSSNPIAASFDISQWPDIAEINCYIMLCILGGNRVYQRQPDDAAARAAYRDSGAGLRPFWPTNLSTRHTAQINSDTTSAEDFPWRSIQLPQGQPRYIAPATKEQNDRQGAQIRSGYDRARVGYNDWFQITFTGAPFGEFCTALHAKPSDSSICKNRKLEELFGTKNVDVGRFIYAVDKSHQPYIFNQQLP